MHCVRGLFTERLKIFPVYTIIKTSLKHLLNVNKYTKATQSKNSLPGNCTYSLYAKTLDILKPQKNILAANQNWI